MKNIVLIGMPGSGKSTLGVLLAKAIGYSFVDTDLIISRKSDKPLQKILDCDGLQKFLKLEEEVGYQLECDYTVVATGGSMVLSEKAMNKLKKSSTVLFIDVPLDEIKRRVTNIRTRGIAFEKNDTLDDVYNKRIELYQKYADITVEFENAADIERTVDLMLEKIKSFANM